MTELQATELLEKMGQGNFLLQACAVCLCFLVALEMLYLAWRCSTFRPFVLLFAFACPVAFAAPPSAPTDAGGYIQLMTVGGPAGSNVYPIRQDTQIAPNQGGAYRAVSQAFATRAAYIRAAVECLGGEATANALDFGMVEKSVGGYSAGVQHWSPKGWQLEQAPADRVYNATGDFAGMSVTIQGVKVRLYADLDDGTRTYFTGPIYGVGKTVVDFSYQASPGSVVGIQSVGPGEFTWQLGAPDASNWYDIANAPGLSLAAMPYLPDVVVAGYPGSDTTQTGMYNGYYYGDSFHLVPDKNNPSKTVVAWGGAGKPVLPATGINTGSYPLKNLHTISSALTLVGLPRLGAQPFFSGGINSSAASVSDIDSETGARIRKQSDDATFGMFGSVGAVAMVHNSAGAQSGFSTADGAMQAFFQALPGAALDVNGNGTADWSDAMAGTIPCGASNPGHGDAVAQLAATNTGNSKLDTLHSDLDGVEGKLDTLHADVVGASNANTSALSGINTKLTSLGEFSTSAAGDVDSEFAAQMAGVGPSKTSADVNTFGQGALSGAVEDFGAAIPEVATEHHALLSFDVSALSSTVADAFGDAEFDIGLSAVDSGPFAGVFGTLRDIVYYFLGLLIGWKTIVACIHLVIR